MNPDSHRTYYRSLDGLRGVAVLLVMTAHGCPWPRSGSAGVDVFFTLSGYLITAILLAELQRTGSIRLWAFYARRGLRLIPCLWLVTGSFLLFAFAVSPDNLGSPRKEAAAALTYLMNWARAFGVADSPYLGHTWSLAIEEQFYLLWPGVVLLLGRSGWSRRSQGLLLLAAAGAVGAYRAGVTGWYSAGRIYNGLDTHADGLLYGAALACFCSSLPGGRLPPRWARLTTWLLTPAAVCGLAGVVGWLRWTEPPMARYGYAACGVCSLVIIGDLVAGRSDWLRRLLGARPLVWTGKVSYGLYLWHFPIFAALREGVPCATWPPVFAAGMALSFAAAAASYYLVERRFLRLKRYFEPGQGRPSVRPAA